MLQELSEKVVWITGAGTGIGESAAIKLAEEGCKVALSGRRISVLEEVASKINSSKVSIHPLDVSDNDSVVKTANEIIEIYGRVDIAVFSAGTNVTNRSWPDISIEDWNNIININLNGAFYCCQSILPTMRNQGDGTIINISSMAAKRGSKVTGPAYISSKHAMSAMTESLIIEERNNGIRATAICPGEVATPILDKRPIPVSDEDKARILQSEDLGELILFVAKQPPHVNINEILINPTYDRHA